MSHTLDDWVLIMWPDVSKQPCTSKLSVRGQQSGYRTIYPENTATGKVVVSKRHLKD